MRIEKTTATNKDFKFLVSLLDKELAQRDGDEHDFYDQFNQIEKLNNCILVYDNDVAVGCGAFKIFDECTVEIKRMYVPKEQRGKRIATTILKALEDWAKHIGYKRVVLETGIRLPEAVALYKKNNYLPIPNYPPYIGIENSVCFEKIIQ